MKTSYLLDAYLLQHNNQEKICNSTIEKGQSVMELV